MSEQRDVTTFRILGPLGIRRAGRSLVVGARRQQAVLAMLLLAAGRSVSPDSLIEAVWPDGPPATGRTQIAICITALRKLFRDAGCDDVIITGPRGYLLPCEPHRIDAVDFADRVAAGRAAVRQGRTAAAIRRFTEALALWHGPALPGLGGVPIQRAVQRLEQERLTVHEELAAVRLAIGEHDTVAGELAVLVKENPGRQTARAQLMLAQYRAGRRQDALTTFADGERVAAGTGTTLRQALLDMRDAIHNDTIRDDNRVKAARATITAAQPVPAQLPADALGFTGRARELSVLDNFADVRRGLPAVGLITGAPGVGKTGLAVHWAHRMAGRFPDGRLFADLTDTDPTDALHGFLSALGVSADRMPASMTERAGLYRSVLHRKRMLVVLDNAESFGRLAPLVPGGAGCCVLVTSRAQLGDLIGRHGATRLSLGPLDIEHAVDLLGRMVDDARVADEPVAALRLAELCDRQPLALRIAAARLVAKPHWTVAQLVRRLSDPRTRLDELAAGEWDVRTGIRAGYQGLPTSASRLFRCLGSFEPAEFGIRLAGEITGLSNAAAEAAVEALVDAHLVEVVGRDDVDETRYRMATLPYLFAREQSAPPIIAPMA